MSKTYRRSAGLAVAAASMLGVAACGGSSPGSHVASLGASNNSGSTTTTLPKGNPSQLLDEWASCMRSHGDPNQVDPTIDANKVIHVTFPSGAGGGPGPNVIGKDANNPCDPYLQGASSALRGGKPPPKPDPAKLEKFSQCMRAHGIADFPDPSSNGLQIQAGGPNGGSSDLNPNNPTFKTASQTCAKSAGLPLFGGDGTPPPGAIEAQSGSGPQGGPGGNGGIKSVEIGG